MKTRYLLLAMGALVATCSTASAHPIDGISINAGLAAGFSHPWLGLDHLLAMLAVGLLGVQRGGRAWWVLPASFLGMMLAGGAAGIAGLELPLVESAIAASVLVLGAALAVGRKYPLVPAAIVIAGFGLVHGHAHGTEMPLLAAPALYATGFVGATALLHLGGIAAGLGLIHCPRWEVAWRLSGAVISGVGACLLLGAI